MTSLAHPNGPQVQDPSIRLTHSLKYLIPVMQLLPLQETCHLPKPKLASFAHSLLALLGINIPLFLLGTAQIDRTTFVFRSTATLTSLPPEVLSGIVNIVVGGTWQLRLWLTGSSELRHSMSQKGALTRVTLQTASYELSSSRWPAMISSLSRGLTVPRLTSEYAGALDDEEKFSLPSTLKTLHLPKLTAEYWLAS